MRCMVPLKAALAQTLSDRVIVRGMRLCSLQRAYSRYGKRSGGFIPIFRGDTTSHDILCNLFNRPTIRLQSRLSLATDQAPIRKSSINTGPTFFADQALDQHNCLRRCCLWYQSWSWHTPLSISSHERKMAQICAIPCHLASYTGVSSEQHILRPQHDRFSPHG